MRNGWTETTLGDVADVNMGQSPPGDTYNAEGIGMPFMQGSAEFGEHYPEPVKFCSAPAKIAEIGDLLLSVRAPVGDSNFANQRIAIGRGLATVRAKRGADTSFLRLVIQLNTAGLLATSGTGMFSSITGKNLREFGVNLPPLAEQKRIVDVVSSVDAYIAALQQQADTARTARNAVAEKAINSGFPTFQLSRIGRIVTGSTPSTKRPEYWEPAEVDFITPGDFGEQ
jgi:type I restriction enzyme S subunit